MDKNNIYSTISLTVDLTFDPDNSSLIPDINVYLIVGHIQSKGNVQGARYYQEQIYTILNIDIYVDRYR